MHSEPLQLKQKFSTQPLTAELSLVFRRHYSTMRYLLAFLLLSPLTGLFAQVENDWEKHFVDSILSVPRQRYMGFQAGGGAGLMEKGAALGVGFNYLAGKTEIGFYFISQGRSTDRDSNDYVITKKTKVSSFAITFSHLFNYNPLEKRYFMIVGAGFGVMDLSRTHKRTVNGKVQNPETDVVEDKSGTLGPMATIGFGKSITPGLDIRLEAPTLFPFSQPAKISPILSHLLLSIGVRF